MSLLAVVVHFKIGKTDRALPSWLGRSAQAWLLNQIRVADPGLAEALHSGQTRRPYTISAPRGSADDRWLRITSLSPDLTVLLNERILPKLAGQPTITLAGAPLMVTGIETTTETAWAGKSDYEALARHALESDKLPATFGLEFATPTTFHRDGLAVPLPLPSLTYGSLIQAWNRFSPLALPNVLHGFIERWIGVAQHRIATRMVQFGELERHVGFTGRVRYMIIPQPKTDLSPEDYRRQVQLLDLLTQFAFYAGVGARTAVGMGQARPLK